jgi:hypothetical protein
MKKHFILIFILMLLHVTSCTTTDKDNPKEPEKKPLPALTDMEKQVIDKLGGKILPNKNIQLGKITIHRRENELSFPAKMCITDGGEYGIEVLISLPHGRTHEALLITEIDPTVLQLALYLIGAENGARISLPGIIQQGTKISIDVEPEKGERYPVESWLFNMETEEMPEEGEWVFVGSSFYEGKCLAKEEGNIVNVIARGNTILENAGESADSQEKGLGVSELDVPKPETPVTVYFYLAEKTEKEN